MSSKIQNVYSYLSSEAHRKPFIVVTSPLSSNLETEVMHLLSRYLNATGELAFIYHEPKKIKSIRCLPNYANVEDVGKIPYNLYSPIITQEVIDFYNDNQIRPIVICAGSLDNPIKNCFVSKYYIDVPHHNDLVIDAGANINFSYDLNTLEYLTKSFPEKNVFPQTLPLPLDNLEFWNSDTIEQSRRGSCFYLGDQEGLLSDYLIKIPKDSRKIETESVHAHDLIRDIFRSSECFYCFADSPLIVRALLCGCPVVLVPNPGFSGKFSLSAELCSNGICFLDEEGGLARAKETMAECRVILSNLAGAMLPKVKELAENLKELSKAQKYDGPISGFSDIRLVVFDAPVVSNLGDPNHDGGLSSIASGELPYVALPSSVIKDIARQVMFEREAWSFSFKLKNFVSKIFMRLYDAYRQ